MIWLDSREGKVTEGWLSASFPGHVTVKFLPTADFLMFDLDGCSMGIERKTVSDFLRSCATGRLDAQLGRLREEYDYPVLLIQGSFEMDEDGKVSRRGKGWAYAAVQMKLWSVQRRLDIAVLHCTGRRELIETLRILHERATLGCVSEGQEARRQSRKERTG